MQAAAAERVGTAALGCPAEQGSACFWSAKPCRALVLDWTAEGGCPHVLCGNVYGFRKCAFDSISSIPSRARGNSMALNSAPTSTTSEIMYIHTSNAMPTPSEP